jgi:starch-binding outer membrane protein, SusD/RagB family
MTRTTHVALVAAGLVLGAVGCNSFLTGVTDDPNNPTTATREALFVGVQATQFGQQESSIPLTVCMWMQQCTGGGGRFVEQFGQYVIDEGSHSFDFNTVYGGGGLTDIRKIEASAVGAGDSVFVGIAQIYEAFVIGEAADFWGDIPYTQALQDPTPALDNQFAVYDAVQTLLGQAILNLGGAGPGPGDRDLVFGARSLTGQRQAWREVAHMLKARYYLHTAEAAAAGLLTGRTAAQVYGDVITEASQGISIPTNDFRTVHGTATSERNTWFQFSQTTFGIDLVAGKALVDLMKARSDPRLPEYFATNASDVSYGGDDVNSPQPPDSVSTLEGTRLAPDFPQPLVTYQERELVLAEAYNQTGDDVNALLHLNNARSEVPLPPLVGVTGAALLDSIMIEKYITLFENVEVWSDYRRTCRPNLLPFQGASPVFGGKIPGRLFYGSNERNTNRANIPTPTDQLANGFRNRSDPAACP